MESVDGFVLVQNKTRKLKKKHKNTLKFTHSSDDHSFDPSAFRKRLNEVKDVVSGSNFCSKLGLHLDHLFPLSKSFESIVSYGIGHVGTSRIARVQYANLLLIRSSLKKEAQATSSVKTYLFDPVLTVQEKSEISADDVDVIDINEECRRNVDSKTTLFYMPHCDKPMYENVLWANWNPEDLKRVVFFGNSFRLIGERTLKNVLRDAAPLLARVIEKGMFREKTYEVDSEIDDDVFNDCCLTWFDVHDSVDAHFWLKPEMPVSCTPQELVSMSLK